MLLPVCVLEPLLYDDAAYKPLSGLQFPLGVGIKGVVESESLFDAIGSSMWLDRDCALRLVPSGHHDVYRARSWVVRRRLEVRVRGPSPQIARGCDVVLLGQRCQLVQLVPSQFSCGWED